MQSDPRNREIDFNSIFDFDSFVSAGEAKLRECVRENLAKACLRALL